MSAPLDTSSLWKSSRTAIVTTLIAIALNPISVFVGYYLGQSLQAPRLKVEYVVVDVETSPFVIDGSTLAPVQKNMTIRQLLDQKLYGPCDDWLSDGQLPANCVHKAIQAIEDVVDQISYEAELVSSNVKSLEEWNGSGELLLQPIFLPHVQEDLTIIARRNRPAAIDVSKGYLNAVQTRARELEKLRTVMRTLFDSGSPERTGESSFRVGILNSGDSDGVVFPDGDLEFTDANIALHRGENKEYSVIGGHSFKELEFFVNDGASKKDSLTMWYRLVTNGQLEDFTISLKASSEVLQVVGRLPP